MRVHSSAPTRLDLAGGTLDIWPLYLFHRGSVTLNAAITLRASCVVSPSLDGAWHLRSEDTGASLTTRDLTGEVPPEHRLIVRLLQHFEPPPLDVVTRSDSPVGAGLAGSSALNIALCGALMRVMDTRCSEESLMQLAMNLEAQVLGIPTGAQDYRPAVYGGISAIELGPGGIVRFPLPVAPAELERRIVLVYTGQSRDSGLNNWEITKRHLDGDLAVIRLFDGIVDVARAMRQALESEDWTEVGHQLTREWILRKQLAPGVTTPRIDALVDRAREAGAIGAKICGAGGGGCLLLFATPSETASVRAAVTDAGGQLLDAGIDPHGLRVSVSQ